MGHQLPAELALAVQDLAAGRARSTLAARSSGISEGYRGRAPSAGLITSPDDVIAYLLTRLPATFAAVATVLEELGKQAPEFRPANVLDAGAGPGTASWAAVEAWPDLGSVSMIDSNAPFLDTARRLSRSSGNVALAEAEVLTGDLARPGLDGRIFDLVVAAYSLTELGDEQLPTAVDALWRACRGALAIVEPGRPRDHQRLMLVRERLIAAGAQVAAPCPHQLACPLTAPDWCHFSVRLTRTRDHQRLKGASLGYEDEKFSYLVVTRQSVGAWPAPGRVIGPPVSTKVSVTMPVCGPDGAGTRTLPSRERAAFKAARKLRWGSAV